MVYTVITAGGSVTPIEAESAAGACEIIEQSHGWHVVAVVDGEFALATYVYTPSVLPEANQASARPQLGHTWAHLTAKGGGPEVSGQRSEIR